jgi:thioredoxin 1
MISPIFHQMADNADNAGVVFATVDVDKADDVAANCQIQAMPTFQFFKGGEKIGEMMGADVKKLESMVAEHK